MNIYAPNIGAPQYIRQTLTDIKGEIDSNITVGDFNTPLTPMDRSSKQKINKETQVLNHTLDEMDLIDIFRTFHPNAEELHPLLKCTWNILQDRSIHILGHKSNLSKFKKIIIILSIFSNHSAETRYQLQEKNCKKHKHMENNTFLNNQQVTEEIKREIKKFLKKIKMKTRQLKTYGMQ